MQVDLRHEMIAALDRKIATGMPIAQARDEVIAEFNAWAKDNRPEYRREIDALRLQVKIMRARVWLRLQLWLVARAWIGAWNRWGAVFPACDWRRADNACRDLQAYLDGTRKQS